MVCALCPGTATTLKYSGNTTNLFLHMKIKHHDVYCKLKCVAKSKVEQPQVQAQPSVRKCLERQLKFPANSQCATELTKSVGYFIAKDLMPLSVVEGEGFCHMLEKLEPRFQPPSRKRITVNVLPCMYSELKGTIVVPSIRSAEYCALTTDCWTSRTNDSYIGLTVHLITPDWKFAHFVVENKELPVSHTAEHLAEAITEIIHDWEITETKISCTTVDNGANVHKSLADVLQWPYLHCFGHTLNLAVKAGLAVSRISHIQAKCSRIVSFFRRSSKAKYTLIEKQKALGLPEHALLQDVCTRWNSTFEMMGVS